LIPTVRKNCFFVLLPLFNIYFNFLLVTPSSILGPVLANGETYTHSIKLIEDWIKETMLKMKDEIRWRQSGINRDNGEPLYEIRNPNPVIDRLLGSYDRISAALVNMNRLRHVLEACVSNPSMSKYPSVKLESHNNNQDSSRELSVPNVQNSHSGIITSLSSSMDIMTNNQTHKFLKPEVLHINMRTDSGDTLESHGAASILTDKTEHHSDNEMVTTTAEPSEKDDNKNTHSAIKSVNFDSSANTPVKGTPGGEGGAGYDMLDMLATVAKNSKDLFKGNKDNNNTSASTAPESSNKYAFENPIPGQVRTTLTFLFISSA
jgi:hypothetical protein